jgi:hypothetical protein
MKRKSHDTAEAKISDNGGDFLRSDWFAVVGILILPFLIFYWLVPFVSKYTIGNDYLDYWIEMQLFLRFSIKNGTFPLYAPGFNCGWTSSALTLGQLWHPISWLASIIPGYWGGHAHQIGTLLRLISLGGTQAVIFLFLRRLRLARAAAIVVSFIAVYNLRMLDMFRYGASLENYTAYLFLCAAVGWYYITANKRTVAICVILSAWLLVVGGHPQIMYIGLLGAALVCFIVPFYIPLLLSEELPLQRSRILKYWLSIGLYAILGILLAAPYILPFYFEYLPESFRGSGVQFSWACTHQDTLAGALCNFFNPFYSDVHGAFGGSVLLMIAVLVPLLLLLRIRIPWPVIFIWLVCLVTFILILGSNGPLYYYFWKYFPFARTFRIPGRLGMIFSFMNVLILAWLFQLEAIGFRFRNRQLHLKPVVPLAVAALVLFVVLKGFNLESLLQRSNWTPMKISKIPSAAMTLYFTAGAISLLALIFYCGSRRFKAVTAGLLTIAVMLQSAELLRYGTWVAHGPIKTPTFEQMRTEQKAHLGYRWFSGDSSRKIIEEYLSHTFLEPQMARVCTKYTVISSREEAYERMAGQRAIDHVYVENFPAVPAKTTPDITGINKAQLEYNSFNNLRFDVDCAQPAFFVFSWPYSKYWRAYVGDREVHIYICNGIEQGVWLQSGPHTVEFRYLSWPAIAGVAISCLTIISVALILLSSIHLRLLRYSAMAAVVGICTLFFYLWYHSLYNGRNIGTRCTWTSEQVQPHLDSHYNLAYGKPTSMSMTGWQPIYSEYSSAGVDGDRKMRSGFVTIAQQNAWWRVDLGQAEPIEQIVIFEQFSYQKCSLPFDIISSTDGKKWFVIRTITQHSDIGCWTIPVHNVTARYIQLQTRYYGKLALAEIEIYGPKDEK